MALILNIETATSVCSVALAHNGKVLHALSCEENASHSSMLTMIIEKLFFKAIVSISDIDAVAVSIGPGSYTGLRIGLSTAKGICFALDKPLISLSTLKILANTIKNSYLDQPESTIYLPLIDARRMEVYTAAYNMELEEIWSPKALILEPGCFNDLLRFKNIIYGGDGVKKTIKLKLAKNFIKSNILFPNAKNMAKLADANFKNNQFDHVFTCEPYYLKSVFINLPHK